MLPRLVSGGFLVATWLGVSLGALEPPSPALGAARVAQNPVVFVHGLCSGNDTWKATEIELARRGWKSGGALTDPIRPVFSGEADADYYLVQFTDPLIQTSLHDSWEKELAVYLLKIAADRLAKGLGQPRFTLVAHSAGGLASRAYLQSAGYRGDVWHLVTYGTPHLGTPATNFRYLSEEWRDSRCKSPSLFESFFTNSVGGAEMEPNSPFLRDLNGHGSPRDVYFTSLVGLSIACLLDGDCVVSRESQDIRNIDNPPFSDRFAAFGVPGQNHLTETSDASSILIAIDRLLPPPEQVPGIPQQVTGSASGDNIRVNWQPPATGGAVKNYVVRAGTAPGAHNVTSGSIVEGTSVSAPLASGTYYISVAAQNSTGIGPASTEITVVVGVPLPGAPQGVTGSASGNTLTVRWQSPATGGPVTAYVVRVGTAPGVYNVFNSSVGAVTSVSGTLLSGTYYVSVAAQNASGVGPASSDMTVVVGATSIQGITFNFDSGVSPDYQSGIREGITAAYSYLQSQFQWQLAHNITIHATTSSDFPAAFAGDAGVTVNTGNNVWTGASPQNRPKIMLHELFHVLQAHNGWSALPTWLVEGSAEFVGYKGALIDKGLLSASQAQGCHIWNVSFSSVPLGQLQSYENTIGNGPTYSLFYLAVERLLGNRGIGILGRVTSFPGAFGVSQSAFYSDFEQYRSTLQRPSMYQCFQ